ncbi:CIRBP [Branchiostoma lanceolatum]|uniref:CIRBP protein n=1 Tax=Branchiostoma lanceolatum TaxID=7740 RepID=A0A8J9YZI4_BRALA|nr:CIRBP [Branchiostoma lanceolatum]
MSGEKEPGKLFVGGLSWDTTSDGLESTFSEYGEITDCKVITDRETNRSRGFGFVTFANDGDAANAKKCMDGTDLDGRQVAYQVALKNIFPECDAVRSVWTTPARRVKVAAAVVTGVAAAAAVEGMAVAVDTAVVATAAAADMVAAVVVEGAREEIATAAAVTAVVVTTSTAMAVAAATTVATMT